MESLFPEDRKQPFFRRGWSGFAFSLLIHVLAIGLLTWLDITFPSERPAPHKYTVVVLPKEKSPVIWFRPASEVPEIRPEKAFGPLDKPAGKLVDPSGQILIAKAPEAVSARQLIRQPDPKPIPVDLPAPNLIAPAPPRAALKVFLPPPPAPKAAPPAPVNIEPRPTLEPFRLQTQTDLGALVSTVKLPPKAFVAPPQANGNGSASPKAQQALPAPPDSAGQAAAPGSGLQAVIVGLDPLPGLPPPGSRAGQFSRAPTAGPASSGVPSGSGLVAPDVMARGTGKMATPSPLAAATVPVDRGTPREVVIPSVNRTMSAPLRPSSRTIPRTVEARFANRNVYTLVIPAPTLPEYNGDWVLWFSEREPGPEPSARISAPVPARKFEMKKAGASQAPPPLSGTVQLAAVIDQNGHLVSVKLMRSSGGESFSARALEEVQSWEFKPALRNGQSIDVDIVLEIPLMLRL